MTPIRRWLTALADRRRETARLRAEVDQLRAENAGLREEQTYWWNQHLGGVA